MKKILVVGSSNIDLVVRVAEMPRKGETIHTKSFDKIPGGKGANQACACGKLGGSCTFLSAVGCDGYGDIIVDSLNAAGVDVSKMLVDNNLATGMAIIAVNDEGDNSIMIVAGANSACKMNYFAKNSKIIDEAGIIISQMETPAEDVYALIDQCKKAGKITILNPAPAPENMPEHVLINLDYITPNETELEKITGMKTGNLKEISAATKSLLARGVRNVIVTMGARGALLCNESGVVIFPTLDADPVDTTAAGDTFNAALAVALAEDKSINDAINFANAAAAISITRKGAQTSIPTREEVELAMKGQLKF